MRLLLVVVVLSTTLQCSLGEDSLEPAASSNQDGSINIFVSPLLQESFDESKPDSRGSIMRRNSVEYVRRVRQTGGLNFGDLPMGTTTLQSIVAFGLDTLQSYYNMVRLFVDAIRPGPLPYEIVTPVISNIGMTFFPPVNGSNSGGQSTFDFPTIQPILIEIVTWLIPVLVVAGLGLVLAILFPLTGCCFCCCRCCCKKCGAKNYKYKTEHELPKCITLSIIFLVGNIFLFVGILLGFLSNEKISMAINRYPNTVRNALTDSANYVNDTLNEVLFIADNGLNTTLGNIMSDIQNAGSVLGTPLQSSLQNELNPFLTSSDTLFNNLDSIRGNLNNLNTSIQQIENLSIQLNSSLLQLQEAFDNLTSECMGNMACVNTVPQFQATDVSIQIDTATLDAGLMTIDNLNINGTRTLVANGTTTLSNISTLIDNAFSNFSLPSISQLDTVISTISSLRATIEQELGENGTVGSIQSIVNEAAVYIELAELYRYVVFVVFFVAIFFIWLLFMVAMLCGVFGYSPKALPNERSAVSNCGARLIFVGITICFLTCGLLLILTSFIFLFTAVGQKFCDDLAPVQYTALERIIDNPTIWGGNTLTGAITGTLPIGITANISVSDFLRRCGEDEPLYQALQADTFFDINSILSLVSNLTSGFDFGSALNIGSMFSYTSDNFIPSAMRTDFENFAANASSSFNLSDITKLLNSTSFDSLNLGELSNNLTTLASYFGSNGSPTAGNRTLIIRDSLVGGTINTTVTALETELANAMSAVSSLGMNTGMISSQVVQTFTDLDNFLNNTADVINMEVGVYVNRLLGYIDGFVNFTVNAAMNEVGRCTPITTVYGAVHSNFCEQTVNGVNGFWFSIGWCVLFLIPIIISTAMVTTYFRKSKTDIHSMVESGSADGEIISNREYYTHKSEQQCSTLNTPTTGW